MKKTAKKQAKKRTVNTSRKRRHTPRYEVPGEPIRLEDLLSHSGLSAEMFEYSKEHHLIPGAVRVSVKGSGRAGADYGWRTGHLRYCELVAQVREAGGGYTLAALRLLVEGLPFIRDGVEWIRKAITELMTRRFGSDATLGSVRQAMQSKRITAQSITRRASTPRGREAHLFTEEARMLSPTRNPAGGMEQVKRIRGTVARIGYGHPLPEDEGLPDLSYARLLDVLNAIPDDTLWRVYDMVRKQAAIHSKDVQETLRSLPQMAIHTDVEIVEDMLPYPGLFSGVPLSRAMLPVLVLVAVLHIVDPAVHDQARTIAALLGLPLPDDVPQHPALDSEPVQGALPVKGKELSIA
jgi:hypothetical protein